MNDAATTPGEADDIPVEELMIKAAGASGAALPLLDTILREFVASIGPGLTQFLEAPVYSEFERLKYTTCDEAMEQMGEDGIFVQAYAQPFTNPIVLWFDSLLLGQLIDAVLGSTAAVASNGLRTFTRLEKHLIDQLAARLLGLLASSYAAVRRIEMATAGLERPTSESADWNGSEKCVSIHTKVSKEKVSGAMVVLLPFPIYAEDYDQLSIEPEAPSDPGLGGWRHEMSKALGRTRLKLKAVLCDTSVPLVEALSWREGSVVRLETEATEDVRVICGDHTVFQAVPGRRDNGVLALRIISDLEMRRIK